MEPDWDGLKSWLTLQRVRPTEAGYTLVVQKRNGDWSAVHGDITIRDLAEFTGWDLVAGLPLPTPPPVLGGVPGPPVRPGQGLPTVPVRPDNSLPVDLPGEMPPRWLIGINLPIALPPGETKPVEPEPPAEPKDEMG